MDGTFKTNQHYRNLRDEFLLGNEGFSCIVYFDTVGIPTVSKGVALLARGGEKPKGKDAIRHFARHNENLEACKQVLGATEYKALLYFVNEALKAIENTPEPVYPEISKSGKKKITRKASFFETTSRGKQLVKLMGPLKGEWVSPKSPIISDAQAHAIAGVVIDRYEEELDNKLKNILDPATLTEEQRIVLLDAHYHGNGHLSKAAAKAIRNNKSVDEVCQCLNDPKYPPRSQNVALLLEKKWPPKKEQKRIPPSRGIREPGISLEQAALMKEYLLPEARPQQLGCSAYDQLMMRYSGAGCGSPLKNVCDPYRDLACRYGD